MGEVGSGRGRVDLVVVRVSLVCRHAVAMGSELMVVTGLSRIMGDGDGGGISGVAVVDGF
jgi:hypothetical protein